MKIEKLSNIVNIIGGNAAPKGDDAFADEGIPFVKMKDVGKYHLTSNLTKIENKVSDKIAAANNLKIVKKGCILMPRSGSVALNHRAILGIDAYMVSHLCALEIKDEAVVYNKYLYYYLTTINFAKITKKTTGLDALTFEALAKTLIPVPSIEQQKHIANILSQSETLIAQRKQSIALLDEYLKSTFLEMFGDPVRNEKGWERLNGEEYSNRLTVGVVVKPASHYVKDGVVALRSLNVRPNRIDLANVVYFSKEANETELSKSKLRENDVVFVRTGMTGTAAIIPKELDGCNCIDLIICTVNKRLINPSYLVFFFNSDFGKRSVVAKEIGGIQKHFNIGAIKSMKIPIPPISLQNQFAQIVQKTEALKTQYKASLQELENLYAALSQKAFKGELVMPKLYVIDEPVLSMAAEPEQEYGKAAKNELNDDEMLQLYFMVINLAKHKGKKEEAYLAEVKMEKSCHLGEYNIPQLQFNRKPVKEKHGPVDFERLNKLLAYAKANDIFHYNKSASFEKYTEGSNFNNYFSKAMSAFRPFIKSVNNLLELLFPLDTNTIDLYATTFAAWNNLLLLKKPTTVKDIAKEARWHEMKKRFSDDDIKQAIDFLKKNSLVPMGIGSIVKDKKM